MSRETASQYFSQRAGVLVWLVGIIGLCMVYVGYAGQRRSVIFMAVGAALAVLCAYELIRSRKRKKTGAELDATADAAVAKRNLYACALKELCLDASDVSDNERTSLYGYCPLPIRTQPYFRRDAADGKLRTSNYQTSMLIFCPDRFYTYTYVVSLVDKENTESGRLWRYDQVTEARVVQEDCTYVIGAGDEKRETSPIEYLSLTDAEGSRFSFFFDRTPDAGKRIDRILELLRERAGITPNAEAAGNAAAQDELFPAPEGRSAARGRDLTLGVIGDEIVTPEK